MFLEYRSDKILGFHVDNAKIKWKQPKEIKMKVTYPTGEYKDVSVEKEESTIYYKEQIRVTERLNYHPFSPIYIFSSDNPKFIFKDEKDDGEPFICLPAFVMYAREESAKWSNWIKVGEYALDILTMASGVGNIIRFGRLYKVLESGKSLVGRSKVFTRTVADTSGIAGVAEISAGSVNILLKLTGLEDTALGQEISKYLSYFEIATNVAQLPTGLFTKMRNSATKLLAKEKEIREAAEIATKNADELKYVDEMIEELRRVAEAGTEGDITKTFFHNARIALKNEKALGKVYGQSKDYTCASSSLKMILDDLGIVRSEEFLADLIFTVHKGKDRGASILDIPKGFLKDSRLSSLEVIARGGGKDMVSVDALEKLLKKPGRKAIVSIYFKEFGAHAVVVDKIENGRVFLRDPLPIYKGSSYSVSLKDFDKVSMLYKLCQI